MKEGLVLNMAYNDFILDADISNYLYKNHTKEVYKESTFTNCSYHFYDDEIDVWCDSDGRINNYEQIYLLVNGRGQNQHVYDFSTIGLQVWVWRQKIKSVLIYKVIEENDE